MSPEASGPPELIYVGDPLCSWCWGFAPSLRKLRLAHPDRFEYRLLVGGLRTGAAAPRIDDQVRAYLSGAWKEVERRSGQPFDHASLETADFVYDTEPACRAVVAARSLAPERVFDYNEALQDAFYHRGLDPTRMETFVAVARELGLSEESFEDLAQSKDVALETKDDFDTARALGANGFPTVVLRADGETRVVARGWLSPEALRDQLASWLA
jgi:putative protein-disulfide isomerase